MRKKKNNQRVVQHTEAVVIVLFHFYKLLKYLFIFVGGQNVDKINFYNTSITDVPL